MLNIKSLQAHYGVIRALDDVSIALPKAGIYAIVGANGAGKTTLLKSIVGLVKPTEGSIAFVGEDITHFEPYQTVSKGICLCPEGRRIFKTLTVYENLLAGAYLETKNSVIKESEEKVYTLFPRLEERKKQLAGTLSGGEQQMLAIGRALMSNPKLLLLDEPSMGLAPTLVELVFETIVRIYTEQGTSVLLVEQNAEMALNIAHYAYVLEVGKLVLKGVGKDLLNSTEVKDKYLGA